MRAAGRETLIRLGLLPSRYVWRNPFKIIEYEQLLAGAEIRPTDVILDIGCGSGPQDVLLASSGARVIGIDVMPLEIERARGRARVYARGRSVEFRCTPIEEAGFAPAQFDKVLSFSVLEHIANRDEVLDVVARVLKPDGLLRFSVDSMALLEDPQRIAKHRSDHGVLTYFTADQLRTALSTRGFRDIHVWPLFKSPYAVREFESAIDRKFVYHAARKFWPLVRIKAAERRYASRDAGLFLCVSAVKI